MKHRIVAFLAVSIATGIMLTASTASAGWVMTQSNGDETIISQGKMKSTWENGAVIFDAGTNEVHFIDDRRKIIAGGTVEELCEGVEQMMESMMANIPPEQREMMKQMMGNEAGEIEVLEKGPGGKIAGFETTRYEVLQGGELYEELWMTEDESLIKECQSLMLMLVRFSSCMSAINTMGAPAPEDSPDYLKLLETGMMVKSVQHGGEGEASDTTIISGRDVPSSAFSLPDGYKKVPLSEMWGA